MRIQLPRTRHARHATMALLTVFLWGPATLRAPAQEPSSPTHPHLDTPGPRGEAPAPALRQQPPTLTLEEALELARRYNPAYRRALNQLEVAGAQNRAAWGAFLPRLNANLGFNQNFTRRFITEDFFGRPIENPEVETQVTSSSGQGLSLSLSVFEGGSRLHRLREADARTLATEMTAETQLVTLVAELEQQFFATQKAHELAAVEAELLAARRQDLEATERRFRLASVQQVDVLAAQLEVAQQELRVEDTRAETRKAMLLLRKLIAAPELPEFALAPEPVTVFDPSTLDLDSIVALALQHSPTLRRREAELAAARAAASAARAQRWPSLSLNATLSRSAFGPDNSALFDFNPRNQAGSVSLAVSVPLFQRFETGRDIAQAETQAANAAEELREERLEVERQIRERLTDLEATYRALRIAERSRELAAERLRLERARYRLAASGFLELQQAVRQGADAERALVEARYRFVAARIALERAVGSPVVRR